MSMLQPPQLTDAVLCRQTCRSCTHWRCCEDRLCMPALHCWCVLAAQQAVVLMSWRSASGCSAGQHDPGLQAPAAGVSALTAKGSSAQLRLPAKGLHACTHSALQTACSATGALLAAAQGLTEACLQGQSAMSAGIGSMNNNDNTSPSQWGLELADLAHSQHTLAAVQEARAANRSQARPFCSPMHCCQRKVFSWALN